MLFVHSFSQQPRGPACSVCMWGGESVSTFIEIKQNYVSAHSVCTIILVILVRCVVKVKKIVQQIDICSVDCRLYSKNIYSFHTIYAELVNTDDESDDFQQFEKWCLRPQISIIELTVVPWALAPPGTTVSTVHSVHARYTTPVNIICKLLLQTRMDRYSDRN